MSTNFEFTLTFHHLIRAWKDQQKKPGDEDHTRFFFQMLFHNCYHSSTDSFDGLGATGYPG